MTDDELIALAAEAFLTAFDEANVAGCVATITHCRADGKATKKRCGEAARRVCGVLRARLRLMKEGTGDE